MPQISFEVWCAQCGAGLCHNTEETAGGLKVAPCEDCLEIERRTAFDDGYESGQDDYECPETEMEE